MKTLMLNKSCEELSTNAGIKLTQLMKWTHATRKDVAAALPIDTLEQRDAYLLWFLTYAPRELGFEEALVPKPFWHCWLANETADTRVPRLSYFERAMYNLQGDMRAIFDLENSDSRFDFKIAVFLRGASEHKEGFSRRRPSQELLEWAQRPFSEESMQSITRLMHVVWLMRGDLQYAFPLATESGVNGFKEWWQRNSLNEYPAVAKFAENGDESWNNTTPGATIIGSTQGQYGMAQHAQMTYLAASEAGVNVRGLDFLKDSHQKNAAHWQLALATPEDNLAVNIFSYNADLVPLAIGQLGTRQFENKINIYYGNWEQESLPESYSESINAFFDAAWAPSKFVEETMLKSIKIPLTYMPLAVKQPVFTPLKRAEFGLPEDKFLFMFMFDASSSLKRKNPEACVQAFKRAFPSNDRAVSLVLKAKNPGVRLEEEDHAIWEELMDLVASDERIILITEDYDRAKATALQNCCDAYISLHRGEGFGYTIAESMLLGKPAIVTAYSGNMDFTNEETALLVGYEKTGAIDALTKCTWIEPDVEHAARLMRQLFEDKNLANRIGNAGRDFVAEHHSLQAIGKRLKTELEWCYRHLNRD